jgi:TPR repeat protein
MTVSCAFCRVSFHTNDSDYIKRYVDRVDKGDHNAMVNLAGYYMDGQYGLARDETKALELLQRAADGSSPWALAKLGWHFLRGELGLIQDEEKAKAYLKDAAKKGDVHARCILGAIEEVNEEHDLAIKHYKLGAAAGEEKVTKCLWKYFPSKLDKAELEATLRAYKEACDEMNSEDRERFIAWQKAKAGDDNTLKDIYETYYQGFMNAKDLKVILKAHGSGDQGQVNAIISKCFQACTKEEISEWLRMNHF